MSPILQTEVFAFVKPVIPAVLRQQVKPYTKYPHYKNTETLPLRIGIKTQMQNYRKYSTYANLYAFYLFF